MQFYKKSPEANNNNEYLRMTSLIKSDLINNLCFECGSKNPQYISINNAVFICKDCIVNHLSFPHDISQIIINDLYSLNLSEIKMLYLGGNRQLIHFINFDFPGLKQLPPEILYKTMAVDYYRKNLKFLVNGGKKPLKPGKTLAYDLVEFSNDFMSKKNEKYFNKTELDTIIEGKDEFDEKENNEDEETFNKKDNNLENDTKNESTMINTPQKNLTENNNNDNNDIISNNKDKDINNSEINNNNENKSFQNEKNDNNVNSNENNINNIIKKYTKKSIRNEYKNKLLNNKNEQMKENLNINEEIKFNTDKNISEIINNEENNSNNNLSNINSIKVSESNNNENNTENKINDNNNLNDDISGDDNTIKIVNGLINISRENDFSDFKSNKENNNDSLSYSIKEKLELEIKEKSDKKNKNTKSRNDIKRDIDFNNHKRNKTETDISRKKKDNENENNNDNMEYSNKSVKLKNKSKDKDNYHKKGKKEKYVFDEEDNDDINEDNINITIKKKNKDNNKSFKTIKNENKSSKSIIIKRQDFSLEEESEEEEEKNWKLNLTEIVPNRHLKARIKTSRIFNINNGDEERYKEIGNKTIKTKKITNKTEARDKYLTANEIIIKKDKKEKDKDKFFYNNKNSFNSGFINPLKYFQKSFQQKQNEKFDISSNSSNEEEESLEEEEEFDNKNRNGIKEKIGRRNKIVEIKTQRKKYNTYVDKKYSKDDSDDDEEVD